MDLKSTAAATAAAANMRDGEENKRQERPFRFSIDRGGTFTDVYAEVPGSKGFRVLKLLSEDPENYPDAPREGVRRILEVSPMPCVLLHELSIRGHDRRITAVLL